MWSPSLPFRWFIRRRNPATGEIHRKLLQLKAVRRFMPRAMSRGLSASIFLRRCSPVRAQLSPTEWTSTRVISIGRIRFGMCCMSRWDSVSLMATATALAAINAIPAVVEAPPGIIDAPLVGTSVVSRPGAASSKYPGVVAVSAQLRAASEGAHRNVGSAGRIARRPGRRRAGNVGCGRASRWRRQKDQVLVKSTSPDGVA